MPTYTYKCEAGHAKDIQHGMMESPKLVCHCGKELTKRLSAPTVTFKGEGFYSTDKK